MPPPRPIDLSTLRSARPASAGAPAVDIPADRAWQAPLKRLLDAVLVLAGGRAATLRLLDPASGDLLLVGAAGEVDVQGLDACQRPGGDCGVCAEVLRLDEPRCETAVCACARVVAARMATPVTQQERVFVLPLHHGAAPCGVLNLFYDGAYDVAPAIQALLPAIGDMVGLALENQRLARRALQDGVTFERVMLAGEVHDSLAQSLTWMRMRLTLLRGAIDQGDRVSAERYLRDLDGSLSGAHARMRELIADFRTRMDPQGLLQALRQVGEQLGALGGFTVTVVDQAGGLDLGAEQELQVFHILREALANVAKHAQARQVRVLFARDAGQITVLVEDDGVGLPAASEDTTPAGSGQHFGLDLMRERARLIGGRLDLLSSQTVGTTLRLTFPDPGVSPNTARAAHG